MRRYPVRHFDRDLYEALTPEQQLEAARRIPDTFHSAGDIAVAQIRDLASSLPRKEPTVTQPLDTPIVAVTVSITDVTGETLTERVELAAADFMLTDLQAAAFWEEADPDTYALFASGEIKVEDLKASALRIRAFLYAITRAKVTDSRIRAQMQVTDFAMDLDAFNQLAAGLESIDVDAATGTPL